MRPLYYVEIKVSIMKTTIHWERQPRATYKNLDPAAHEEVQHCVQLLKLGKPIINEVPLLSVPGIKVAWLQSGYVLMFTRQLQQGHWRNQVVISIKHIVKNDRLIPVEFFYLGEEALSNATPVKSLTNVLDDAQRIGFSMQVASVLFSVFLALIVFFSPKILSMLPTSTPDVSEEKTSLEEKASLNK